MSKSNYRKTIDMATKDKAKLTWMNLDVSTLKGDALKAYEAYQTAKKAANDKRTIFEDAVIAEARKKKASPLANDKTLAFSYRFGDSIGVAVADQEDRKTGGGSSFKLG